MSDGERGALWVPVRNPRIEASDMPDGIVLFDPSAHTVHHLNAPAALIWELVDGRSVAQICHDVCQVLEVTEAEASAHVESTLERLRQHGVLT